MQNEKFSAILVDENIFEVVELVGIKNVLTYYPTIDKKEKVGIIVYETSTGVDFVKIKTKKSQLGIQAEYAWLLYTDPCHERGHFQQACLFLEKNESEMPCDEFSFLNTETGERKSIYFDISDFFDNGRYRSTTSAVGEKFRIFLENPARFGYKNGLTAEELDEELELPPSWRRHRSD